MKELDDLIGKDLIIRRFGKSVRARVYKNNGKHFQVSYPGPMGKPMIGIAPYEEVCKYFHIDLDKLREEKKD